MPEKTTVKVSPELYGQLTYRIRCVAYFHPLGTFLYLSSKKRAGLVYGCLTCSLACVAMLSQPLARPSRVPLDRNYPVSLVKDVNPLAQDSARWKASKALKQWAVVDAEAEDPALLVENRLYQCTLRFALQIRRVAGCIHHHARSGAIWVSDGLRMIEAERTIGLAIHAIEQAKCRDAIPIHSLRLSRTRQ